MKMEITQYGLSVEAGGWDGAGDAGTDKFLGNAGNVILNGVDCALSDSARRRLGVLNGHWLQVKFPNGFTYRRRVGDSTAKSLTNDRVDFFNAYSFDRQMDAAGMQADVTVLP